MDIRYEIEFFTYWHCGSGLAAGADVDMLVIKDSDGLPFVPGKTIKGLIREAAEDIAGFTGADWSEALVEIFGNSADRNLIPGASGVQAMRQGVTFFSDATLKAQRKEIIAKGLNEYMYSELAYTAIGEDGVALDHSLRKLQVTVPCVLHGSIINVPDDAANIIVQSMDYIKRLGLNRNRGLGRCKFTVKN